MCSANKQYCAIGCIMPAANLGYAVTAFLYMHQEGRVLSQYRSLYATHTTCTHNHMYSARVQGECARVVWLCLFVDMGNDILENNHVINTLPNKHIDEVLM